MPTYRETLAQMPSLGEMMMRMKARRQQNRNPGDVPADASGRPVTVRVDGEQPMMAQPVGGGGAGQMVQQNPMVREAGRVAQQGPTQQQIQQMMSEGKIDPRMAQMMLSRGQR